MMLKAYLLAALLFANIEWSVSQDDGAIESTAMASTEDTALLSTEDMMSSTEMESTEDSEEMTSTDYGSDSGSDSESEDGESSSAVSSTEDSSDSSDSSDVTDSSDDDESSSDDDDEEESDDDDVDESSEDDNDTEDDGEDGGDDGSVLDSEEDDQDTDEESTEGPEDVSESTEAEVDPAADDDACIGLDANECGNTFGDDGMQLCGYNTMTENCYEVVMTAGTRGSGNFDDGYTAAQAVADEQAAQLYTAIGVLGGIMAILVLTVLGGAYYIRSNRKHADYQHTAVPMDIIDVDGGRSMTKGQHTRIESHSVQHSTDSTPMLDTM